MSDVTPNLGLIRSYWQDPANILDDVHNWNALDRYIAEFHDHDGTNSSPVAPENLDWIVAWLMRHDVQIAALQVELNDLRIFVDTFYEQFLRHNHTGAQTVWLENFTDTSKTDTTFSTTLVTPARRSLSLPANYEAGRTYHHVGRPFPLNPDTYPEADKPTTAKARIIAKRRGEFTPYLSVRDGLTAGARSRENPLFYPGAVRGEAAIAGAETSIETSLALRSIYAFRGKRRGMLAPVSHEAYHHIGNILEYPAPFSANKKPARDGTEFSQAEYDTLSRKDDSPVVTSGWGGGESALVSTNATPDTIDPTPLYSSDHTGRVLAFDGTAKRFYFYETEEGRFTPLADAGPLMHDNLTGVAATYDPDAGKIYVLKTFVTRLANPPGYFAANSQLVEYDPEKTGPEAFVSGAVFTTLRAKAGFWPAVTISPTHLEVYRGKLYAITEADALKSKAEDRTFVNYYSRNATLSGETELAYQYFPFGLAYSEAQLESDGYVNFALFNPGILASKTSFDLKAPPERWIPNSPPTLIGGAYSPTRNSYATLPELPAPPSSGHTPDTRPGEGVERSIEGFEGVNTKTYLGREGEKLYFYQGFCPYNPERVSTERTYEDAGWLVRYAGVPYFGIVEYDLASGTSKLVDSEEDVLLGGAGGATDGTRAVLAGGAELSFRYTFTSGTPGSGTPGSGTPGTTRLISPEDAGELDRGVRIVVPAGETSAGHLYYVDLASGRVVRERLTFSDSDTGETGEVEAGAGVTLIPRVVVQPKSRGGNVSVAGGRKGRGRGAARPRKNQVKKKTKEKVRPKINDDDEARQMFVFRGLDVADGDTIRFHVKGRTQGLGTRDPRHPIPNPDYRVFIWAAVRGVPTWVFMDHESGEANSGRERVFRTTVSEGLIGASGERDKIAVMVAANRRSDAKSRVRSRLDLDYVELSTESPAYAYDYEWGNLPQGDTAALVLECRNTAKIDLGVEIKAIKLDIDSSKG